MSKTRLAPPMAFSAPEGFRDWLEEHHGSARELLVRCYKSHALEKGMTYPQAVDQALCFGWIDGVRRRLDGESFSVRFSPRKAGSVWSAVNVKRADVLEAEPYLSKLRANKRAWAFFQAQAPWYRRTASFWVMSAKQDETRLRRLQLLISCSEREKTIPALTRPPQGRRQGRPPQGSKR
jgi:uncharacterized protein YdeI (YjbR/CyaY-like superfamily)